MPALSFAAMFADRVERGEKLHSIRARRKRPEKWLPGKTLHLFTAMRTKHCRRLGTGTITEVLDIEIDIDSIQIESARIHNASHLTDFARADGFLTWAAFVDFFKSNYGLPWSGQLIKWDLRPPNHFVLTNVEIATTLEGKP